MTAKKKFIIKIITMLYSAFLFLTLAGCEKVSDDERDISGTRRSSAITEETAADGHINFSTLKEENPDIFAWIYIPNTGIDYPILQDVQSDDFYENHNAYKEEDAAGALYIELANVSDMCDFNTVIHGNTGADEAGPFDDLYRFAEPNFFEENEHIYLYLDGNILTYEIFAAYERENTSLLRTYDFTYFPGCRDFLQDLYNTRSMNMHLRDGWDFVNPYHFLITLTTQKKENDEKQFIVVAVLVQDAAGSISRVIED